MFKKNSWIVALLLALTLTAFFTGCIDALVEEDASYTEVELGEFNIWGGQTYQRGWAVGGMKFLGVADKAEVAADKGYKNEDFAKATKLVIEMEDATHPNGNLDIIWGAADAKGDSVGFDWKQTGGIKSKKEGNILTIDLTAMGGYPTYKTGDFAMRKIVLQAGGEKAGLPFVKKAKLLIPNKEEATPADPMDLPGKGNYAYKKIADTATASEVYLDLNLAQYTANCALADKLDGSIVKGLDTAANPGTITARFSKNTQGIFIPFDAATKAIVLNAGRSGFTVTATIDGTFDKVWSTEAPYKTAADGKDLLGTRTGTNGAAGVATNGGVSPAMLRWCIATSGTSDWNKTGLKNVNPSSLTDYADFTSVFSASSAANWDALEGIIIQSRPGSLEAVDKSATSDDAIGTSTGSNPHSGFDGYDNTKDQWKLGGNNTAAAFSTWTAKDFNLTIKSIKITISGTASASPGYVLSTFDITIPEPVAGLKAQTKATIDNAKAEITWIPAPVGDKWQPSTIYRADIVITPNKGFVVTQNATITVKVKPSPVLNPPSTISDPTVVYNAATSTVSTAVLPITGIKPVVLQKGKIWSLADWFTANPAVTNPTSGGLRGASTENVIDQANKKLVTTNTNMTQNWNVFYIDLPGVSEMIDPATFKIKVKVTGKTLALNTKEGAPTKGVMKLGGTGSPYNEVAKSATVGVNEAFTIEGVIPANYFDNGGDNGKGIRLQSDGGANGSNGPVFSSFEIYTIEISNEGDQ